MIFEERCSESLIQNNWVLGLCFLGLEHHLRGDITLKCFAGEALDDLVSDLRLRQAKSAGLG